MLQGGLKTEVIPDMMARRYRDTFQEDSGYSSQYLWGRSTTQIAPCCRGSTYERRDSSIELRKAMPLELLGLFSTWSALPMFKERNPTDAMHPDRPLDVQLLRR